MKALPIAVAAMVLAGCTAQTSSMVDKLLASPAPSQLPTSTPTAGPVVTNTQIVLDYVGTRHAIAVSRIPDAIKAAENQGAATGGLLSGATQKAIANAHPGIVQAFLNDTIAYAKTQNAIHPVDKSALAVSLNSYRSQDISYISSYFASNSSTKNFAVSNINSAYDLALFFPF